jgi:dihydroorotate dehydrogenase
LTNTIKFGAEGLRINWRRLFWWRKKSPLAKLGGGGLSGKPLFEPLCQKVMSLKLDNIWIPIKASGGISSVEDIFVIRSCGAGAVEFATAISLRPWRIYRMVKTAKEIF